MTALRAGAVGCGCEPTLAGDGDARTANLPAIAGMATSFGLAVLSQTIAATVMPLAALQLGMADLRAVIPYIAMLVGAGIATFPATLLSDGRGRRGGLAIGAAIGVGGGLLGMIALDHGRFDYLVLAAFWIGVAQGFGLFHRHLAAGASRSDAIAASLVLGAGAIAGLLAPSLIALADTWSAPIAFRGAFGLIAAIQTASALAALAQRPRLVFATVGRTSGSPALAAILPATLLGAIAWFGMNFAMAGAPLAMIGCGLGSAAVAGAIAWHGVAMYAGAPVAGLLLRRLGAKPTAGLALALLVVGFAAIPAAASSTAFGSALIVIGFGWGLATTVATVSLARSAPSRIAFAIHDASLFAAAIGGALIAALV